MEKHDSMIEGEIMEKTLGQIAYDANQFSLIPWHEQPAIWRSEYERMAAAVAAAVKEEDARICKDICDRKTIQAAHIDDDEEERTFVDGVSCGADDCYEAIRASIKEGK